MNWISFVLEIYCHKLDVIQHFKSIWRSRLFSRQVNITLPCWKKSHLEERFLNSAKRANLPLKSLSKGTGEKVHFGWRYFIDLFKGFFSNASFLSPQALLLQVFFFQISCWLCQRTRCSSLCRFAHQRNKGWRESSESKQTLHCWSRCGACLPFQPRFWTFVSSFFYSNTFTRLLLKSGEVKNVICNTQSE